MTPHIGIQRRTLETRCPNGGLQSAAGSLRRFQRDLLCSAFFLLSRSWLRFSWDVRLCAALCICCAKGGFKCVANSRSYAPSPERLVCAPLAGTRRLPALWQPGGSTGWPAEVRIWDSGLMLQKTVSFGGLGLCLHIFRPRSRGSAFTGPSLCLRPRPPQTCCERHAELGAGDHPGNPGSKQKGLNLKWLPVLGPEDSSPAPASTFRIIFSTGARTRASKEMSSQPATPHVPSRSRIALRGPRHLQC